MQLNLGFVFTLFRRASSYSFRSMSLSRTMFVRSRSLAMARRIDWRCSGWTMPKRKSEFSPSRVSERPEIERRRRRNIRETHSFLFSPSAFVKLSVNYFWERCAICQKTSVQLFKIKYDSTLFHQILSLNYWEIF